MRAIVRWLILVLGQASAASEGFHCVMAKSGAHRTLLEYTKSQDRWLRDCGIMEQRKDVDCTDEVIGDAWDRNEMWSG